MKTITHQDHKDSRMSSDSSGNSKLRMIHCYYRTCTLLALVAAVSTYNLDVSRAKIFSDPNAASSRRSSYFGYSVALYVHQNVSLLLVGAPRANSSRRGDKEQKVYEPGAVYYCDLSNDKCTEWLLDASPNNKINHKSGIQQNRNSAWIGATVVVENSTSPRVAVCAPLWKQIKNKSTHPWRAKGMCYGVNASDLQSITGDNNIQSATRHFPVINKDGSYSILSYGLSLTGFSAHIVPDAHRLVVGAPGTNYFRGSSMILEDDHSTNSFQALYTDDNLEKKLDQKYDSLFGYSMTSGKFFERNKGKHVFATGAPRSDDLRGAVFMFDTLEESGKNILEITKKIEGKNFGEYFGSSLTACDVNGDGRDDLIIGAPLWSSDVEEGRVYAYISKGQSNWAKLYIDGKITFGRFGSSLACLGDLDHDGFQDVAVGAPYEDDGRGAIYIYSGSGDRNLFLKPSQRIVAKDLSLALWGFGHSLSEPARDVNGDGYPDLAVGSFTSRHAVLLPSKPIIKVTVNLRRLANSSLSLNSTHLAFEACAKYNGAYAPDTFDVTISIVLTDILWHKLYTTTSETRLLTLHLNKRRCEKFYVPRNDLINDAANPIQVNVNITCGYPDSSHNKCPMFHPKSKTTDSIQAYARDCGSDELCITDLKVNITSNNLSPNNSYTIGSGINVYVTILVENTNEPAYLPEAHIFIPEPITLVKQPPNCKTLPQVNKTSETICLLVSPLRENHTYKILLELDMNSIESTEKLKEIRVDVTSDGDEKNPDDNNQSLIIYFDVDADLRIIGESQGHHYGYLKSELDETHVKKFNFHHIYEIEKLGITPIQESALFVNVPVRFQNFEIASISQFRGSIDGNKYNCTYENASVEAYSFYANRSHSDSSTSFQDVFSISCTNPHVTCQNLRCDVGSFLKTTSAAELVITIDFRISDPIVKLAEWKNISYVSQAYIEVITPNVLIDVEDKAKHFMQISTTISRSGKVIPISMILLSLLFGILILIIVSWTLYKLGFFKRNRMEDS